MKNMIEFAVFLEFFEVDDMFSFSEALSLRLNFFVFLTLILFNFHYLNVDFSLVILGFMNYLKIWFF